jgi:hypothetical protein
MAMETAQSEVEDKREEAIQAREAAEAKAKQLNGSTIKVSKPPKAEALRGAKPKAKKPPKRRPPKGKPGHRKDFTKRKALVIWITPQLRKKLGAAAKAKKLSIAALARQCFERLAK